MFKLFDYRKCQAHSQDWMKCLFWSSSSGLGCSVCALWPKLRVGSSRCKSGCDSSVAQPTCPTACWRLQSPKGTGGGGAIAGGGVIPGAVVFSRRLSIAVARVCGSHGRASNETRIRILNDVRLREALANKIGYAMPYHDIVTITNGD